MMKTLRLFLVAALAMMVGNVSAEDILWQEDFSSYAKDDVPSGGDYNYVCVVGKSATKIYADNLAGGTSPELLVSKNNGSFTATIPLNGKSGEMTLSYKANYDRITVTATGATIGEKTSSGNTYMIPVTVEAGTTSVTLVFTNTTGSNARLDDIKLYQGTAKKPAGLSWGKASTKVTLGGDYSNIPTLQNENNLSVTCTSSDEAVCTVTNEGVITVEGAGETVITASFAGNDEYEAQEVSITITVEGVVDPDAKGGQNNPYNIEELIAAAQAGQITTKIYVKGYITNIEEVSTQYGNATYKIATNNDADAQYKLRIYRGKYLENATFTAEDQIKLGDLVVVYGALAVENEEGYMNGGYIYSLNGQTSGVNVVKANQKFQGKMYNVAGQMVNEGYKGLVIMNGTKFVNK